MQDANKGQTEELDGQFLHIGIVQARFNEDITNALAKACIEELEANVSRIETLLDQSLMLVTALTPQVGYDRACAIAKHAHNHQLSLREAALVLGEISAEQFDNWVQPNQMI
jgi:fumarate hydratase class II